MYNSQNQYDMSLGLGFSINKDGIHTKTHTTGGFDVSGITASLAKTAGQSLWTKTKALGSALWDVTKSMGESTLTAITNFLTTPLNAEENSSSLPMTTDQTTPAISNEERKKLKKDYMGLGLSEEEAGDLVASLSTAQNEISYSYEDLLEGARAPVSDHKPSEGPKGIETDLEEGTTPAPQTTTSSYVVKKGDTLTKIAKRHGMKLNQLLALNTDITNPNFIKVGQKINLVNKSVSSSSKTSKFSSKKISKKHLIYSSKVSSKFEKKVKKIAKELNVDPNYLMAVMHFETGGAFKSSIKNGAGSGAVGLIQFMPNTAEDLGTTTEKLSKMTAIEQLDYVYKYFEPYKDKLKSLTDVYMRVLSPIAIGKSDDYVLFKSPSPSYKQNIGFDKNKDKKIIKKEVSSDIIDTYKKGVKGL